MPKHHKTAHHYSSHYKVGLGEAMLVRSRVIFLALIAILILSSGTAIYAGIKNGSLQRNIIEPSKQLMAAIGESFKESTPSAQPNYGTVININNTTGTNTIIKNSPTPLPTQTPTQKPTVIQQPQPIISNCIRKNIREGEFASNKCYSQQDYEDLNYYLSQYNSAVWDVSFYETKVRITCGNNDFHKTCEQDKKDQQANSDNIPRYRSTIQGIIARGK